MNATGTLCESILPGRCPTAQQGKPGRYHITASIQRKKT